MNTLLFIPSIDTRHALGIISSRIGLEAEAIPFQTSFEFFNYIQKVIESEKISCILVDEAQFLTKQQVIELARVADELKIPVLAYGLRSDFLGEPFEGSQYLLAWAEELSEIKTICHCGKKATMNARFNDKGELTREGEQIQIGGNDRYIALCRKHFMAGIALPSKETVQKTINHAA